MIGASSFAQSAQSGVDPSGEGVVTFTGTMVGSCTAPTVNVNLANIDFHLAKNGATGVYEQPVDISVTCTNPNQTWAVAPHVASFTFDSGLNGSESVTAYVSFSSPTSTPGTVWSDVSGLMNLVDPTELDQAVELRKLVGAYGTGTETFTSKLTFGKNLPAGAVANSRMNLAFQQGGTSNGGVPTGTIDGRGAFSVDIPLQIMY